MSLKTPEKIRTLHKKLYAKAKRECHKVSERETRASAFAGASSVGTLACLGVKPVREPDAGEPHVRFDERVGETEPWWEY